MVVRKGLIPALALSMATTGCYYTWHEDTYEATLTTECGVAEFGHTIEEYSTRTKLRVAAKMRPRESRFVIPDYIYLGSPYRVSLIHLDNFSNNAAPIQLYGVEITSSLGIDYSDQMDIEFPVEVVPYVDMISSPVSSDWKSFECLAPLPGDSNRCEMTIYTYDIIGSIAFNFSRSESLLLELDLQYTDQDKRDKVCFKLEPVVEERFQFDLGE